MIFELLVSEDHDAQKSLQDAAQSLTKSIQIQRERRRRALTVLRSERRQWSGTRSLGSIFASRKNGFTDAHIRVSLWNKHRQFPIQDGLHFGLMLADCLFI